jgi:CBS domain-containing protein
MRGKPTLARDIMVTKLVTLPPHMDAFEAIGLLLRYKISGAPVIDEHRNFLGVFSEKCSMTVVLEAAYDQLPTNEVCAFMDREPLTIDEDTDMLSIAQIFQTRGARRLPVLRDGKLVGQVSRRDVLQAVHDKLSAARSHDSTLLYLSSLVERHEIPFA